MRLKLFILLSLTLLFTLPLGAATAVSSISDSSFNGTLTLLSDGRLQLSMRDGSSIFLGPGPQVDPQQIGKSTQLSLRQDAQGKVIFAADPQKILIYTFQYNRDGVRLFFTDPLDMVSIFWFDPATGKATEALLPSGRKIQFP